MKNKGIVILVILICFFTFLCSEGLAETEPIQMIMACRTAPNDMRTLEMEYIKILVEQASNNRIEAEVHHSGVLGTTQEMLEMLIDGTIHLGLGEYGNLLEPALDIFSLPFLWRDRGHVWRVLDGPIGEEIANEYLKHGIRVLPNGFSEVGFRHITNNARPINSPEDLNGLKFRVPDQPAYVITWESFGVNPTPIQFHEVYMALQTGVVDGQENPLSIIYSSKFYEVQKYISLIGYRYSINSTYISEAWWKQLPEDLQNIVIWAVGQATAYNRSLGVFRDREYVDLIKEEQPDIQINEVNVEPFYKIAKEEIWPKLIDKLGLNEPKYLSLIDRIQNFE